MTTGSVAIDYLIENGGAQGRQFRFEMLPAEFTASIDVITTPTADARAGNYTRADAAASAAQAVSTDYYPGTPLRSGVGFRVTLPGGVMERCNPVLRAGPGSLLPGGAAADREPAHPAKHP